jgi:hypothetical protein
LARERERGGGAKILAERGLVQSVDKIVAGFRGLIQSVGKETARFVDLRSGDLILKILNGKWLAKFI